LDADVADEQAARAFMKINGAPRKRGSNALSDVSGTNPREFSIRKGAAKSKSRP
jgi:hypothetical protein